MTEYEKGRKDAEKEDRNFCENICMKGAKIKELEAQLQQMTFNKKELSLIQAGLENYILQMDYSFIPQEQEYLAKFDKLKTEIKKLLHKIKMNE